MLDQEKVGGATQWGQIGDSEGEPLRGVVEWGVEKPGSQTDRGESEQTESLP